MLKTDRPFLNAAQVGLLFALSLTFGSGSLAPRDARAQEKPVTESKAGVANAAPQEKTLRIVYAGKTLTAPVAPYRDPADNAVCVPVEMLETLGIISQYDADLKRVAITTTDGSAASVIPPRIPPADVKVGDYKGVFIPIGQVITSLGGRWQFDAETNTLYLRSVLRGVDVSDGKIRIGTTLPVIPRVVRDNGGKLLIVDLPGVESNNLPKPQVQLPNLKDVRVGQFESDTARVVLEFDSPTLYTLENTRPANLLTFVAGSGKPVPVAKTSGKSVVRAKPTPKPSASPSAPATIKNVEFYSMSPNRAQFVIKATRTPDAKVYQSHGKLSVILTNASPLANADDGLGKISHPFLNSAPALSSEGKVSRLVLDMTRIVNYSLLPDGQGNVILDIALPRSAGGKLAGKTVVVDAGHGGTDKGAPGVNGQFEKDLNLAMAFQVAALLREAGANVIMARSTDYLVPLYDRSKLANQAGADFFISIHCNDPGNGNRKINGSKVYYHGRDANCRTLALAIAERFEDMGGIRSNGVGSDFSIYSTGFAVLRTSKMVGVLVETGFMTNPNDVRHLSDKNFQKKVAVAVVAGLRDYIEGKPGTAPVNNVPDVEDGSLILPLEAKPVPAVVPLLVPQPETQGEPHSKNRV